MEHLAVNLTYGGSPQLRQVVRDGREYIVAPLSLIVPGVLNGSLGALYYPAAEIAKNPTAWNHMPIVVNHPEEDGRPVSARLPRVLDRCWIGNVYHAAYTDKLVAEGWFDVAKTRKVDPRVLNALQQGQAIELSTGLTVDTKDAPPNAVHNGTPYQAIASNYRPDHLAVLPDEIGACSVNDGCGVNVNKHSRQKDNTMTEKQKKEFIDSLISNSCCWEEDDRETLNELSDAKLKQLRSQAERDQEREAVINAAREGFRDERGNTHSYDTEKRAWTSKFKEESSASDNGGGDATNANAGSKAVSKAGEGGSSKKPTAEEWLATAPPEIQGAVRNAMAVEQREKQQLIDKLTANLEGDAKESVVENLKSESLDRLRILSALAPQQSPESPQASYAGASTPAANQGCQHDKNDYLPLPVINWAEGRQAS